MVEKVIVFVIWFVPLHQTIVTYLLSGVKQNFICYLLSLSFLKKKIEHSFFTLLTRLLIRFITNIHINSS